MASYEDLMTGARRAHEAGDAVSAKRFLELAADAKRAVAQPAQPEAAPVDGGSALGAGIVGAAQAVTGGLAEEGKAGIKAAWDSATGDGSFGENYDRRLAETRGDLEARTAAHPYASAGGQIAGSLLLPGGAFKSGASIAGNALRMGAAGGLYGGAYGFGAGEGGAASRARSAAVGAGVGFGTGAIAGGALGKLEQGLTNRATRKAISEAAANAPTPKENWVVGDAAYRAMRARGVKFDDTASARLLAGVRDGLEGEGFHMGTAGPTLKQLRDLAVTSKDGLSFSRLLDTRSALRTHTLNFGTSDAKAASVAMGKIDEFMDGVMDADAATGSTAGLSDDWKEARRLWTTYKKSDKIAKAIEAAQDARGGVEKGLHSAFRTILKKERLTPAEKQVVREVLKGSRVGNLIREHAGTVMGTISGYAIGGPWGAAIGAQAGKVLGRVGGRISENASSEAARRALGFVAGGGQYLQPAPIMLPPAAGNALQRGAYDASQGGVNLWNR